MGRPRKPKTDAKPEGAAPGKGHNKPELTEDELRVLTYQHKGDYEKAQRAVKEAQAELKSVAQKAKAELGKGAVADIKELMLLEQPKAAEALRADFERKAKLARWVNLPIGSQISFMDFDGTPAVDAAFELGKTAGLKGEINKPPYDTSVPQYQSWIQGWHEGQAVLCSNFREKLKPDTAAAADNGEQMDLSEREDVPGSDNTADVSDPPFAAPPTQPQ